MATIINADTSNGLKLTSDTSGDLELQSGGTTKAKITSSGLQNASGSAITSQAGKNLIINGDMQISQRGTSFSNASGYTLDRFTFTDTGSGEFTVSQSTDVPSGQGFASSMKLDCTTANASLGSGDQVRQIHKIEGYNLQQLSYGTSLAKSLTMSFWVKSNKTGTYCVTLSQEDRSYASYTSEYTISASNTWEKKTLTFDGDTSGVINNDNGAGLWVMFAFGAGSGRHIAADTWVGSYGLATSNQVNLSDSTSNELYLTGVQLEVGTVATPFEHRPYDMELARCMRYYEQYSGANSHGALYNTGSYIGHIQYKVRKRTRPTLTATGNGFTSVSNSSSGDEGGTDNMFFNGTSGGMYIITLTIDAEL